jgi:hypothetical protein
MHRRSLISCLAVVSAVVFGAARIEQAQAAGYWNVPGTFAQRAGHGYGGGYHAPLILGPVRCDGWGLGAPTRLPSAPSPYYGCGSYGDCGRVVEAPSSMEGVVPTAVPAPTPMPSAAAPVETRPAEPAPAPTATPEVVGQAPEPAPEPAVEQVVEPVRPLFDPPVQH